jgi:hypothetical protein
MLISLRVLWCGYAASNDIIFTHACKVSAIVSAHRVVHTWTLPFVLCNSQHMAGSVTHGYASLTECRVQKKSIPQQRCEQEGDRDEIIQHG